MNHTQGKVLFLVDGLGLSGKTKSLVELACGLDPVRYRAEICCLEMDDSPLRRRLAAQEIRVHQVYCRKGVNFAVVKKLISLMKEVRPNVVHCYNPRPMLYGGVAARWAGIRQSIGSLSAFACLVPTQEFDFLPQPLVTRSWKNRWRNRLSVGMVNHLVSVSRCLGEGFCQYNGLPLKKLRVVPYGISLDAAWQFSDADVRAKREQLGAQPGDVIAGSVGRLVEQKDYPVQLRAFAIALRCAPELRMILVGDGPLRERLHQLVSELGISHRVHFLGHTDQVPLMLRCMDLFVMTSQFEPYGVALIEAKAAGLPIVATRVNEIPEIVSDGQSGLLVPARSPEPLADALVTLAKDAALRHRLGEQSLAEARERYDLRKNIARYQDFYDELRAMSGRVTSTSEMYKPSCQHVGG